MSKAIKYLILAVSFAAVLVICVFAYNKLSESYVTYTGTENNAAASNEEAPEAEAEVTETEKAADFTVLSTEGNTVSLSDYFGKPIIVNFWASWCGPCTGELPAFEKLYGEYGDEIEFMMVNMTDGAQETQNSAMRFLVNSDYTFSVYLDTEMEAATAYGVYFIPQTLLINERGEIVHKHLQAVSEEVLRESIERYLIGG